MPEQDFSFRHCTRSAQYDGLTAEASYKLQKVGGNILAMLK